jgi:hypothetical protein
MAGKTYDKRENEQKRDDDKRAAWERPVLRRLAANEAQMDGANNTPDGGDRS